MGVGELVRIRRNSYEWTIPHDYRLLSCESSSFYCNNTMCQLFYDNFSSEELPAFRIKLNNYGDKAAEHQLRVKITLSFRPLKGEVFYMDETVISFLQHNYADHTFVMCDSISEKYLSNSHEKDLILCCTFYPKNQTFEEGKEELEEEADSKSEKKEKHTLASISQAEEEVERADSKSEKKEEYTLTLISRGISNLLKNLKALFLALDGSDFTIQVQSESFRVHKAILTARSPVLASMVNTEMEEKITGTAKIPDFEPEIVRHLLHYVYTGQTDDALTSDNVLSLYQAADLYDVQDLKLECVEFMKRDFTVDTICDVIELSLRHDEKELLRQATQFFAQNALKIIKSVKWQTFMREYPTEANELNIKALEIK